jgi:hypothetical protein
MFGFASGGFADSSCGMLFFVVRPTLDTVRPFPEYPAFGLRFIPAELAACRLLKLFPMKSIAISALLLAGLVVVPSIVAAEEEAQNPFEDKVLGLGFMVGEPTGANLKYWLSEVSALDAAVGVSLDEDANFACHADYLYHFHDVIPLEEDRVSIYLGGGPRFKARDNRDDFFGVRTIVGVAYVFREVPMDLFLEAGPVFDVSPDFELRFTAGVGARYWF